MKRSFALACIALSIGAQATLCESSFASGLDADHAERSVEPTPFRPDGSNGSAPVDLQRAARARSTRPAHVSLHQDATDGNAPPPDVQLALACIGVATLDARTALVDEMRSTVLRQRELATTADPDPAADDLVEVLDYRLAESEQIAAQLREQRAALLGVIDGFGEMPVEPVASASHPESDGPATAASTGLIPDELPHSTQVQLETDENAGTDRARALQTVLALQFEVSAANESVQIRQLAAEVAARRWRLGAAAENDAIEARQRLLADEDLLAVVRAQLACAWIALNVGGSGASTPDREGAVPASRGRPPSFGLQVVASQGMGLLP